MYCSLRPEEERRVNTTNTTENISETLDRQNRELLILNNPLQLYPSTLDTLMNHKFPPTRWVVEGLLPAGGMTIMSAAPGSFKTWLMLEIALSATLGKKLFNEFATEQTGVLLVDEESGPRILQERFRLLGADDQLPIMYFSREGHKVTQSYIESLISVCLSNEIGLVIFDSLVRIHQGDENASKDMSELFDLFKQLADQGISVLIAHHNRKGIPGTFSPSGDMRGSSDILAAVDCHMALVRQNGGQYILVQQTKNRYMQELKPFKLRFTESDDKSQFEFVESLQTKDDLRDQLKIHIIEQLSVEPEPTKKDLLAILNSKGVEIKLAQLGGILSELKLDGFVDDKPGIRNAIHYFLTDKGSASKTQ